MIIVYSFLSVLLWTASTEAGEIEAENILLSREDPHDLLKRQADITVTGDSKGNSTELNPYFYEIKDASKTIVARLQTQKAFFVELVKTAKTDNNNTKVVNYVMDGRKIKKFGNYTFDTSNPEITAVKTATNTSTGPSVKMDISFRYTEKDKNDSSVLKVQDAELKFTVQWGEPLRRDYWNITSVSLIMNAKVNTSDQKFSVDLTPQFTYSGMPGDSACTNGYGICAPVKLCWTCTDQVLKPNDLTSVGSDSFTILWHMQGLRFEPDWGQNKNSSSFKWSFNWDCDPLIPLPVWVGLLVTLLLASILIWAIQMLAALQCPNKWDDPKKPGIQVAQTE